MEVYRVLPSQEHLPTHLLCVRTCDCCLSPLHSQMQSYRRTLCKDDDTLFHQQLPQFWQNGRVKEPNIPPTGATTTGGGRATPNVLQQATFGVPYMTPSLRTWSLDIQQRLIVAWWHVRNIPNQRGGQCLETHHKVLVTSLITAHPYCFFPEILNSTQSDLRPQQSLPKFSPTIDPEYASRLHCARSKWRYSCLLVLTNQK